MADIGDIYDGVNLYTGSTIDKTLYLLQPQGTSLVLDCSKSFSMTRKNIVATAYPSGTRSGFQCTFNESYTTIFSINFGPSGNFYYMFTVNGNDKIAFNQSHAYPLNAPFDIRIDYDASLHVFSFKYKLSSSDTWTTLSSVTYTISLSNPIHLTVGGESNAVTSELSGVEIISDGTVLFSRDPVTPSTPIPKIGSSNISKIYLGSEEISKIYLGSEVVYEAEVTPPTPAGPVFELDSRMPSGYDTDDVADFLSGQTTSLPLSLYSTSHGGSIGLTCSDWTRVRKIRINAPGTDWYVSGYLGTYEDGFWKKDGTWNGSGLSKSYTSSTAGRVTMTIKDTVDRSTIDSLWITCNRSSATLTNFTVYDDNDNIIIPAS